MHNSPPDSSADEIFQARKGEQVAIFFSKGSSWPRDWTLQFWHLLNWQLGSLPLAPPWKPSTVYVGEKKN